MSNSDSFCKLFNLLDSANTVLRKEACNAIVHSVQISNYSLSYVCYQLLEKNKKCDLNFQIALAEILSNLFKNQLWHEGMRRIKKTECIEILLDFDLENVIHSKSLLFGSDNLDVLDNTQSSTNTQRAQIEQSLGISSINSCVDSKSIFSDEDLLAPSTNGPTSKKMKIEATSNDNMQYYELLKNGDFETSIDCILQSVLQILNRDLFAAKWELRHCAALCIGSLAEKCMKNCCDSLYACVGGLLDCLALDRFNDYGGSVALAPVRSACSKALALIYNAFQSKDTKTKFLNIVKTFLDSSEWEVQQSGLLVVKNLFTNSLIDHDEIQRLMDNFYDPLVTCLTSKYDDVSACAAYALLPLQKEDSSIPNSVQSRLLVASCWLLLEKLAFSGDETCSLAILQLLSFHLGRIDLELQHTNLLTQIVKVHCSSQVRKVAFDCLRHLWDQNNPQRYDDWPEDLLESVMNCLFHRCVIDNQESTLSQLIINNVDLIIIFIGQEQFVDVICTHVGLWLAYLMLPDSAPFLDPEHIVDMNGDASIKQRIYLAGPEIMSFSDLEREECARKIKFRLAQFLAPIFEAISMCTKPRLEDQSPAESLHLLIVLHIQSNSYLQKTATLLCLIMWAKIKPKKRLPSMIFELLNCFLTSPVPPFEESIRNLSELNRLAQDFLSECGLSQRTLVDISLVQIKSVCQQTYETSLLSLDPQARTALEAKWRNVNLQISNLTSIVSRMSRHYKLYIAVCCLCWDVMPDKVSPVIQPLMECVKEEDSQTIMSILKYAFPILLTTFSKRTPCPNSKVLKNLVTLFSGEYIPVETTENTEIVSISLEDNILKDIPIVVLNSGQVLQSLVKEFGCEICDQLPGIWEILNRVADRNLAKDDQMISLQVLDEVCCMMPHSILNQFILDKCCALVSMLDSSYPLLRYRTVRCLVSLASVNYVLVLNECLPWCLDKVNKIDNPLCRAGIIEFWWVMSKSAQENMVGYSTILCPNVLSRMSDPEPNIRLVASKLFPLLVQLLPLSSSKLGGLSDKLSEIKQKNADFLDLLTDPAKLSTHMFTGPNLSVELRSYQKEGIIWLTFLSKYNLHGILADEMGLGKTLQTLCAISTSYSNLKEEKIGKTLIICPRTLVSHWINEIAKYFSVAKDSNLQGSAFNRGENLSKVHPDTNIIVTSYDVIRKQWRQFSSYYWFYCILDEGHVIKNRKTQLHEAILSIKAEHRLILTGTPVQNSVLELWALFEFLLPGYLGTEKEFNFSFAKPILASRDAKSNSAAAENGQKALQILHKRVLPFILRRQKFDVLKDLPEKIIQDYPCIMTPVQKLLHDSIANWCADQNRSTGEVSKKGYILRSLIYMRKLCDHPCLVIDDQISQTTKALDLMETDGIEDRCDLGLSGKFLAFKEILLESNVGRQSSDDLFEQAYADRHRILVFCQFTKVIDLLEMYMQNKVFGDLKWLRLDGTVPANKREIVAQQFNNDHSIDLLLLTTQVGGLGLNLTGADVVIFIDHDWNPVKDLQAMDRAHRLGQKKTVNVYRLITKDTIEERIMHLQRFKTHTAESLVGQDNKSLMSMATQDILNLLKQSDQGDNGDKLGSEDLDLDQLWGQENE